MPQSLIIFTPNISGTSRSRHWEVFLGKSVLKICSKFTGEHPCRSVISIVLCNFIEITGRHACSPEYLLHIFRTSFIKNTSEWLLLYKLCSDSTKNLGCSENHYLDFRWNFMLHHYPALGKVQLPISCLEMWQRNGVTKLSMFDVLT